MRDIAFEDGGVEATLRGLTRLDPTGQPIDTDLGATEFQTSDSGVAALLLFVRVPNEETREWSAGWYALQDQLVTPIVEMVPIRVEPRLEGRVSTIKLNAPRGLPPGDFRFALMSMQNGVPGHQLAVIDFSVR